MTSPESKVSHACRLYVEMSCNMLKASQGPGEQATPSAFFFSTCSIKGDATAQEGCVGIG